MAPHRKDEAKLIAAAKQGRQQLEELFALEREQAQRRQERAGWSGTSESLALDRERATTP
jgi:glutathione-regulated potassium-efflux system ancillary protein KefC